MTIGFAELDKRVIIFYCQINQVAFRKRGVGWRHSWNTSTDNLAIPDLSIARKVGIKIENWEKKGAVKVESLEEKRGHLICNAAFFFFTSR